MEVSAHMRYLPKGHVLATKPLVVYTRFPIHSIFLNVNMGSLIQRCCSNAYIVYGLTCTWRRVVTNVVRTSDPPLLLYQAPVLDPNCLTL